MHWVSRHDAPAHLATPAGHPAAGDRALIWLVSTGVAAYVAHHEVDELYDTQLTCLPASC
jgi:hypothetical protein